MRNAWLTATVAAVFGLQMPLCAAACWDAPSPSATHAADASAPPCHGEPAAPGSLGEPSSHDGCGCQLSRELPLPAAGGSAPVLAIVPTWDPPHLGVDRRDRRAPVSSETDLPPPDVLLLKSTLLL